MSREESSDPLPYLQLDRSSIPKAGMLAAAIGCTPQHAVGSLAYFWQMNGDPRALKALLEQGIDEVVLTETEVMDRFHLASGHRVPPELLVRLGFLERRDGGMFRIRGMSRVFEPVRKLADKKRAARAGGKARAAKAKRTENGAFQRSSPGWEPGSSVAEVVAEQNSSTDQAANEAATRHDTSQPPAERQPAGQADTRSDVRRQMSDVKSVEEEASAASKPAPVQPPFKPTNTGEEFWVWAQETREKSGYVREKPPQGRVLSKFISESLMELNGDLERLKDAWWVFGEDKHWEGQGYPFNAFVSQWRSFVPKKTGGAHGTP